MKKDKISEEKTVDFFGHTLPSFEITKASAIFLIFVVILWIGQGVLIPFVFAVLLWFVIVTWRDLIVKMTSFGRVLPVFLQNTLAFVSFIALMFVIGGLVTNDIEKIGSEFPRYQESVEEYASEMVDYLGLPPLQEGRPDTEHFSVSEVAEQAASFVSNTLGTIVVVILYVVFIFYEQKYLTKKLKAVAGASYTQALEITTDIADMIKQYIGTKTLLSISTAVLSYAVLALVGLDFPFLWAFLIFVLNYIPSIGSLMATALPVLFAMLQFDGFTESIIILATIGIIQFYIGNILEPKLMGKKLNISPLVVVIALFSWGALWGIPGMFLSVPLTVVMIIIMAHIPTTRSIAIWLSGDGEV